MGHGGFYRRHTRHEPVSDRQQLKPDAIVVAWGWSVAGGDGRKEMNTATHYYMAGMGSGADTAVAAGSTAATAVAPIVFGTATAIAPPVHNSAPH